MDFGKFLFEQNKKSHAAKRKQKQIQIKEIKFRPGTDENDYQIKLRNIIRFLTEGDKAKVTLRFRGREIDRKSTRLNSSHVEISYAVFCLKKKKNTIIISPEPDIFIQYNRQIQYNKTTH